MFIVDWKNICKNQKGFTGKAKDWVLKYTETYSSKSECIKREFQIKKWKSRKMIESLVTK